MTIRPIIVAAIGSALLLGIMLPMANAQAPPCFTFDGKIQTMQCPVSFRPAPVQYYSNPQSHFVQATDNDDRLPSGFFDQQTINTLRENAAQTQNQSATQEQEPTDEQLLAQQQQLFEEQATNATAAGANQTALGTNLTSSDIEPVRNSLNAARQSIEHNDSQAAIESINRADGALFAIITKEDKGPVTDGLTTLSDDIERTRASVRNLDNEKAAADLNAADSQLLLITEMLPTTTATETEEPQPQSQSPANQSEIIPPMPEPEPAQNVTITPEPAQEPTIKIPLNQTQQELVTIEEVAGLNITTHEKSTVTIVEGNKTTHREITTTEVPL